MRPHQLAEVAKFPQYGNSGELEGTQSPVD